MVTSAPFISNTKKNIEVKITVPLHPMFKRFVSILTLCSALAIMLGHNFVGHYHHVELNEIAQHYNNGHHHANDNDDQDKSDDWGQLFSGIQHGTEGSTFLPSRSFTDNFSKQVPQPTALHLSNFTFQQPTISVEQNAPPYVVSDYSSQNLFSYGLRGPPVSIV